MSLIVKASSFKCIDESGFGMSGSDRWKWRWT
jgi:hypothetical protein